jgi:uncharacterized membrane protein
MKTSSLLERKDPDVFWLRVHLRVKVEFAVYSLSFALYAKYFTTSGNYFDSNRTITEHFQIETA